MIANVNGWKMWGEPAPSVALPPELEDVEPTVCGYAPRMPVDAAPPRAPIAYAPVGAFDQIVHAPPVPDPSPEGTVVMDVSAMIPRDEGASVADPGPARAPAPDADGAEPLVELPGPEEWTTSDSEARPFHWAGIRPRLEPAFSFTGAAAEDSQVTFIGSLDMVPRTRDESQGRGESVLESGHSSWLVAAVAALLLAVVIAGLYATELASAATAVTHLLR